MASDDIEQMLADGWVIEGYAVDMMAMGALAHSVLLRKGTHLTTVTVVTNSGKELGRTAIELSPRPMAQPKKGFFG